MNHLNEYHRTLIPLEGAAGLVKSGMWVDYRYSLGFPRLIDEALAQRASHLESVKTRAAQADRKGTPTAHPSDFTSGVAVLQGELCRWKPLMRFPEPPPPSAQPTSPSPSRAQRGPTGS